MERGGVEMKWIDGKLSMEEKVRLALEILFVI
jgi:hypothetical protein